jgi:predicted RND superfamily exporter protein
MFIWLAEFLQRRRYLILACALVVTLVAAGLAIRIEFDFTPQAVFAGHDELVDYSEQFKETFGYEDTVLLILLQASGPQDVLHRDLLNWQGHMVRQLETIPQVERIDAVATLPIRRLRLFGPPWMVTAPLVQRFPVDEAQEHRVREALSQSGLIEGSLLSEDLRVGVMAVFIDPDARDIDSMKSVVRSVEETLSENRPPEGYYYSLSGLPALRVDIVDQLIDDQLSLLPLAGLLLMGVLLLIFRSVSGTLIPMLAVGMGLAWTTGMLVITHQSFNIISNVLPVMLLIIGVSNCVHVVSRYSEEYRIADGDRMRATRRTIAHMALPCMLTYLTTAIGFGSLVAARAETLRGFGWQAAMGIGFLYITTIVVLGTCFTFFRAPTFVGNSKHPQWSATWITAAVGRWVAQHPWSAFLSTIALILASLFAARHVVVNSHLIETYAEDHPMVRAMRVAEESLGGFVALELSLKSDEPDRFLDPDIYRRVAAAEHIAAGHDAVLSTRSYVDLHQEVYANVRRRPELRDDFPPDDEAGSRRIRFTTKICRRLAGTLNYYGFITPEADRARILIRVRDIGTRRTLLLIDELDKSIGELFPPQTGIRVRLTGDAYLNAQAMDGFVRDLLFSLLAASMVIFAVIALLFRSVRVGVIATLPNLTPLIVTLGYMGIRGYDLNVTNVIVFAISLGVAVDDTIHFLSRFREELKSGDDLATTIHRSYIGTGRAIVLTTIIIASGLSILLVSEFLPTRRFAELTMVTMLFALIGDLILLPACLVLFWKRPTRSTAPVADSPPEESAARGLALGTAQGSPNSTSRS